MIRSTLIGAVSGRIWMPAVRCTKPIRVDLTDGRSRYSGGPAGTFRHFITLNVVNDGDFQSSSLTRDSVIVVESDRVVRGVRIRRSKTIPITRFRSIRDCVLKR